MITILTPTYNRAHTLPRLYQSLVEQTKYSFEWLVIDDGSTDETEQLITDYQVFCPFNIRYYKKENGGKHTALNLGFKKSEREWIFIVDSDDWLTPNTIEMLSAEVELLDDSYNSVSTLKVYQDNSVIGDEFPNDINNYIERVERGVKGDKADIIRRVALDGFFFPEYNNENFMAESPLFLWLGIRGNTHFVNFGGYVCEYLEGGLSDHSIQNRHRCFNSTLFVYKEQFETFNSFSLKSRAAINWWRFKFFKNNYLDSVRMPLVYSPLGFSLYIVDKVKGKV